MAYETFEFTPENQARLERLLTRYPTKQAVVLPALWLAQEQVAAQEAKQPDGGGGWIPQSAMVAVARALGLSPAYVLGVVSFYTMYQTRPVGRHLLEVCTSVSCCLTGGEELYQDLKSRLGVEDGGTTPDGRFTLRRAECLASCGTAPMLQINGDRMVENLDSPAKIHALLAELR